MEKMYYPDSSIGVHNDLVTGWIATKESNVAYVRATNVGTVNKSGGTPSNYTALYPSLGNPSSTIVPNGSTVYTYPNEIAMFAEDGNPNAWRFLDWAYPSLSLVHMNGWHMNAYAY
jgi:hypothetical protein